VVGYDPFELEQALCVVAQPAGPRCVAVARGAGELRSIFADLAELVGGEEGGASLPSDKSYALDYLGSPKFGAWLRVGAPPPPAKPPQSDKRRYATRTSYHASPQHT
jgi:hypothetical protein